MEETALINLSLHKQIHCIGIGGIGLSAIVEVLINRGYFVTGSDMKESEITDKLIAKGACIFLGHRAKNIDGADLVVYSSAIANDNPERVRAKEMGIPSITRAEMLGLLMKDYKNSVAVSGAHGKTTTTSMISLILEDAKKDPTILVGGNLEQIGGNVKIGEGEYFITEACEYMDSFLSLKPKIEIILNIDSDHLDYFKDIEHIVRSFKKFTKLVPENGEIIAFDGNPFVHSIINELDNVITFGFNESCTYYGTDIDFGLVGMPRFTVNYKGKKLCKIQLAVPGEHNILNALAAVTCCNYLGIEIEAIVKTLEAYKGTQRRFDLIGITKDNINIVEKAIIGKWTIIYPNVILEGNVVIGEHCHIGQGSKIVNSRIGEETNVESSFIIDSVVGNKTSVGPFAYLRPNSHVGDGCKVGDFVEVKNSNLGNGTKASHLSYIGDSDVGENVNIGCGVVFVNYDGSNKHRSIIEDGAFIRCNVNIIAPVTVEAGAYIAAGSTVTVNVPKGALCIARARARIIEGWVSKRGLLNKCK